MESKLYLIILVVLVSCTKVKDNKDFTYKCVFTEYKNEYDNGNFML